VTSPTCFTHTPLILCKIPPPSSLLFLGSSGGALDLSPFPGCISPFGSFLVVFRRRRAFPFSRPCLGLYRKVPPRGPSFFFSRSSLVLPEIRLINRDPSPTETGCWFFKEEPYPETEACLCLSLIVLFRHLFIELTCYLFALKLPHIAPRAPPWTTTFDIFRIRFSFVNSSCALSPDSVCCSYPR